jgi:hypothetical protein
VEHAAQAHKESPKRNANKRKEQTALRNKSPECPLCDAPLCTATHEPTYECPTIAKAIETKFDPFLTLPQRRHKKAPRTQYHTRLPPLQELCSKQSTTKGQAPIQPQPRGNQNPRRLLQRLRNPRQKSNQPSPTYSYNSQCTDTNSTHEQAINTAQTPTLPHTTTHNRTSPLSCGGGRGGRTGSPAKGDHASANGTPSRRPGAGRAVGGTDRRRSLPSGGDGGDATAWRLERSPHLAQDRYARRRKTIAADQTREPKTLTLPSLA